jgi:hypothetical protein
MGRRTLYLGRRYLDRPAGHAYRGRRWGVLHPVPSILVVLVGPFYAAMAVDPR